MKNDILKNNEVFALSSWLKSVFELYTDALVSGECFGKNMVEYFKKLDIEYTVLDGDTKNLKVEVILAGKPVIIETSADNKHFDVTL